MKRLFLIAVILSSFIVKIAAQQNWAAIPCSKMPENATVDKMWVDSLHNEIILYSINGYNICNTTYKGIFGYNGSSFHDLDYGVNINRPGLSATGVVVNNCITYGNRTLFGGGAASSKCPGDQRRRVRFSRNPERNYSR